MSDGSKIEWTEATWNPVTGCTKVSPGCDNCYAETFAERWRGTPGHYFERGFDVVLRPDKLEQPLRWKRPRRVFVNSMSDLFHDEVPDEYIVRVFDVMLTARRHTFQVLTKRHARMRSFVRRYLSGEFATQPLDVSPLAATADSPPPNVWLGVSVEDQKWADIRIPALIETPAAVRFLSCEPLLGPVDLKLTEEVDGCNCAGGTPESGYAHERHCGLEPGPSWGKLHWVIAGGESGPGARPMRPEWARSLRDQCRIVGVPFFFKQWGSHRWVEHSRYDEETQCWVADGIEPQRVSKKLAGRLLDGREWNEFPHAPERVAA